MNPSATNKSRFTSNGSFGGVTCGVRIVAVNVQSKSTERTLVRVCSGTLTSPVFYHDNFGANIGPKTHYFGEDGIPVAGRGYVKISGASAAAVVVWRTL